MKSDTYKRYITPKTKAGGMSANRYQRLREEQLETFYKEAAEFITSKILPIIDDVDMIVFGGNTIRAQEFLKRNLLSKEIVDKISDKLISTSMINDDGIEEAKKKLPEILKDSYLAKESEEWNAWVTQLSKETGKAIYGEAEIELHMKDKRVEKVLCLEDYNLEYDPDEYKFDIFYFSAGSVYKEQLKAFGGCVALLRY
jgi:peptide chain release factor subunit 1